MLWLSRLSHALRSLFRKQQMEQELDEELRFHLERQTAENIKVGMSPEEAHRAARLELGGVEQVKEKVREVGMRRILEELGQDVRFGIRILARNPGFTAVAVLTLALGIGANTAIFSMVNGVLLRSLPYQQGDRLVVLRQQQPGAKIDNLRFSVKEILDYREQNQTLDEVVEYHGMEFTLLGRGEPQRVLTGVVSANFFEVLGVKPLLGRTFLPGEDEPGTEPILVLTYEYWQGKQGGDPDIVGQTFELNGNMHTVVGVLPPVPQYPRENDIYMPTSHCPTRSRQSFIDNRQARMMRVFGRLKPGVSPEQAQSDVAVIAQRLRQDYPDVYPDHTGYTAVSSPLRVELTKQARPTLLILMGTVGLVLLIACANVANLTLSRLLRRERELAVRAALGASRGRLLRQLLTENTLLAVAAGALGLLFAAWGLDLLIAFAARFTTRASEIGIDGTVLLFTLFVSVGTGIVFGVIPAFKSRPNLVTALNEGGSRSSAGTGAHRVRSLLVVAQMAVSLTLLIGAGLMVRSLIKLQQVDGGFNHENVLTMRVGMNYRKFPTRAARLEFFRSLQEKVEALPGVVSTAVASAFPLSRQRGFNVPFQVEGQPILEGQPRPVTDVVSASPRYFRTMGIPLIRGRFFENSDDANTPSVLIISQSMARHYWEEEDPLGKRISADGGQTWETVVGIVGDTRQFGMDKEPIDVVFQPFAQNAYFGRRFLVRTTADPMALSRLMIKTVHEIDPEQPVDTIQTLEQVRSDSIAAPRLTTILIGLFAVLALVISAAGIGSMMALSVSQHTHEIGIRMALGAQRTDILRLVLRQALMLILLGAAVGLAGTFVLTRFLESFLFGVSATDPVTFGAVAVLLAAVALLACYIPARRATKVDPMVALRYE